MAMGRSSGFSSKKKLKRLHASRAQGGAEMDAAADLDDGGIGNDDGEPQLAEPARKKAREEPTRKSRRGEPEKRAPPLQGPRRAKPQRTPSAELSEEALEARRKQRRKHDKAYYRRNHPLPPPAELEGEAAYARTKTGKPRKDTDVARKRGKARAMDKLDSAFASIGDEAQQAQALKDYSEGRGRSIAQAAGYHLDEEVEVAVYEQGQRKRALKRAAATEKPRARRRRPA